MSLTSLRSTNPRPCIGSVLVHQTKQLQQKNHTASAKLEQHISKHLTSIFPYFLFYFYFYKAREKAKRAAIQVATMPADHKQRTTMKNQNKRAALRQPAMKLLRMGGGGGGELRGQLVCGRPTLTRSSALVPQTISFSVCVEDSYLINALS